MSKFVRDISLTSLLSKYLVFKRCGRSQDTIFSIWHSCKHSRANIFENICHILIEYRIMQREYFFSDNDE